MEELRCNNGRQRKKKLVLLSDNQGEGEVEVEDRLRSLPDAILTEILSLLPIQSAAATSVLSRWWRHRWTAVTSVESSSPMQVGAQFSILSQLTSPIIRKFVCISPRKLVCVSPHKFFSKSVSCFRLLCSRNVEVIKVAAYHKLRVPDCVFNCQTLVTLELDAFIPYFLRDTDQTSFNLPNLRKLSLRPRIDYSLVLISTIVRSCPLLEDLCLMLNAGKFSDYANSNSLQIFAPNLKSLVIVSIRCIDNQVETVIDAPKLAYLKIRDSSLSYRFVRNPILLETAEICFKPEEKDEVKNRINDVAKFVSALSSVRTLQLKGNINLFYHLDSMVDSRAMPNFRNLACFKITLHDAMKGWNDLLLSLQCCPILEVLEVTVKGVIMTSTQNFPTPVCLSSTLKTVKISGLLGSVCFGIEMTRYFVSNALVLKHLQLETEGADCEKAAAIAMECMLCEAAFKLPRSSSTSVVVFSGKYIKAASNAMKDGVLDCQIHFSV